MGNSGEIRVSVWDSIFHYLRYPPQEIWSPSSKTILLPLSWKYFFWYHHRLPVSGENLSQHICHNLFTDASIRFKSITSAKNTSDPPAMINQRVSCCLLGNIAIPSNTWLVPDLWYQVLPCARTWRYVEGGTTAKACYLEVGSCPTILGILMGVGGPSLLLPTSHKIYEIPRLHF